MKDTDYENLKARHIGEFQPKMDRVYFRIGNDANNQIPTDERLASFKKGTNDISLIPLYFQYGRYLLLSSSRRPGILPANLQGIWNKDMNAIWNSDFHTNINIQMNYWPSDLCNVSETFEPFSDYITAMRVPGRVTARKTFGAKGWTINHVSNPFGHNILS